eukprot:579809-Pleurochrysis_carterae.AAC.2
MSRVEGDCAGRDVCVPCVACCAHGGAQRHLLHAISSCAHLHCLREVLRPPVRCHASLPQSVVVPHAWLALLVAFALIHSRTDSAFMQLACWRTVLRTEFINSVLAQLHDIHCFAEPLYSREQLFLRAHRLALGHRATFTPVFNSAALDTLALINITVFAVAVPALPVPWFVDLTFASALGASDDL